KAIGSARTSRNQVRTLFNSLLDQPLHLVELSLVRQGTDGGFFCEWLPDFCILRRLFCRCDRRSHLGSRNEHTGRRVARLSGVAKAFLYTLPDRFFQISVIQNNIGRLPA